MAQIRCDHDRRIPIKTNDSFKFDVFYGSTDSDRSTSVLNGQFVHSQLLINCLLRMRDIPTDKNELITLAEAEYKDNKTELAIIQDFEATYSSDRSLWWYTRESFLYRQLNKALRRQDIDLLFAFRFFIRDIHKQLEQHRCSSPMRVYRGQLISKKELDALKTSIGNLISIHSFISTSVDRRSALSFLYSSTPSDNFERVLFEIDANPLLDGIKPFADITSFSYFPGESEVLFMLGSILRIISIDVDERGVSTIRATLCSNNDQDVQAIFDYMKNENGDGDTTMLSFGIVLGKMGKLNDAEKYFRRLLKEIPPDHVDIAACYHDLGDVLEKKGDYESSLASYHKSLEIMLKTKSPNDPIIATSYNNIAAVQIKTEKYDQALESYTKALAIWRNAFGDNHPHVALCLSNLAGIYQAFGKSAEALDYLQKALSIRQHHLPADHPDMGDTHNNIGILYWTLDQLDKALEHYDLSLKIKEKCLTPYHPDVAMTLSNISLIYEQQEQFSQVLSYLQRAAHIYQQTLSPTHPNVLHVQRLIQRVTSKMT